VLSKNIKFGGGGTPNFGKFRLKCQIFYILPHISEISVCRLNQHFRDYRSPWDLSKNIKFGGGCPPPNFWKFKVKFQILNANISAPKGFWGRNFGTIGCRIHRRAKLIKLMEVGHSLNFWRFLCDFFGLKKTSKGQFSKL